jgi:hypothetical protein
VHGDQAPRAATGGAAVAAAPDAAGPARDIAIIKAGLEGPAEPRPPGSDPSARGSQAGLRAIKAIHTLAWFSIEGCMVYVLYAGFAGRSDRRAGIAAAVVAAETLIFARNGFRCPLTQVAERLGAERGSVTDNRLPAPILPASAERRREHINAPRAVPRLAIDRALTRRDVPLREKTLWRMLYETADRASEVLALNIEDLDLDARRAPIRSKGGDTEWICWGSGIAHLLPRLVRGRQAGPVFGSERRPGPARRPAAKDLCRPPDGPGSAMTAPGSCSPGTPGGTCTSSATPQPPTSVSKASPCS